MTRRGYKRGREPKHAKKNATDAATTVFALMCTPRTCLLNRQSLPNEVLLIFTAEF